MTDTVLATRATIIIGPLSVDGFMLPDGSYRMSLSQAGQCVGKTAQGISNFLKSKALKRLLGEGRGISNFLSDSINEQIFDNSYKAEQFAVSLGDDGEKGETRVRGVHLEVVALYWQWEAFRGNKQAFVLSTGLTVETLDRRFDNAFGVERSESERNAILGDRIQMLTQDIERLGEAYAIEDDIRRELEEYKRYVRDRGLPGPYSLEDGES